MVNLSLVPTWTIYPISTVSNFVPRQYALFVSMQKIYGQNSHSIVFLSQDASHNIRLIFKWLDWNSLRGCSVNHDEQLMQDCN